MKIKFLATFDAPDSYSFSGDILTFNYGEDSDTIDLSGFTEDAKFENVSSNVNLQGSFIIRDMYWHENELYLILCQKPSNTGHWVESDWIDSQDYNSETLYIQEAQNGVN